MAGRRIHVVMDASLVERVDAAASGLGVSRGEFVRRAVERALEFGDASAARTPPRNVDPASAGPALASAPAEQLSSMRESRTAMFRRATQR